MRRKQRSSGSQNAAEIPELYEYLDRKNLKEQAVRYREPYAENSLKPKHFKRFNDHLRKETMRFHSGSVWIITIIESNSKIESRIQLERTVKFS